MVYLHITSHISMPRTRDHDARVHAPGVRLAVLPVLGAAPLPLVLLVAGVGGAQRRRAAAPNPASLVKIILSHTAAKNISDISNTTPIPWPWRCSARTTRSCRRGRGGAGRGCCGTPAAPRRTRPWRGRCRVCWAAPRRPRPRRRW